MKKIFLNLFVLTALVFTTACSSDDDASGNDDDTTNKLIVSIDGVSMTFDTIVVDQVTSTDIDVIATMSNDATKEFYFASGVGATGSNAIFLVTYENGSVEYYSDNQNPVTHNVTVNNGSNLEFTFSGTLIRFNQNTSQQETIVLENGSLNVEY
jgi:hypothetical protein